MVGLEHLPCEERLGKLVQTCSVLSRDGFGGPNTSSQCLWGGH